MDGGAHLKRWGADPAPPPKPAAKKGKKEEFARWTFFDETCEADTVCAGPPSKAPPPQPAAEKEKEEKKDIFAWWTFLDEPCDAVTVGGGTPSKAPPPQPAAEKEMEKEKEKEKTKEEKEREKKEEDIAWFTFFGEPWDADTVDARTPKEAPPPQPAAEKEKKKEKEITWTFLDDGRYLQFSAFGIIFEFTAKYHPIKIIGRGSYGIVCSAVNKETGEHVAIKMIPDAFADKIAAKRTLREIKLLRHLDHENVVGIIDIIPPPMWWDFNDVYIAYELMDTDLLHVIHSGQHLSEEHFQGGLGFFLCHLGGVVLACDFIGGDYSCHTEAIVAGWSDSLCNVT